MLKDIINSSVAISSPRASDSRAYSMSSLFPASTSNFGVGSFDFPFAIIALFDWFCFIYILVLFEIHFFTPKLYGFRSEYLWFAAVCSKVQKFVCWINWGFVLEISGWRGALLQIGLCYCSCRSKWWTKSLKNWPTQTEWSSCWTSSVAERSGFLLCQEASYQGRRVCWKLWWSCQICICFHHYWRIPLSSHQTPMLVLPRFWNLHSQKIASVISKKCLAFHRG